MLPPLPGQAGMWAVAAPWGMQELLWHDCSPMGGLHREKCVRLEHPKQTCLLLLSCLSPAVLSKHEWLRVGDISLSQGGDIYDPEALLKHCSHPCSWKRLPSNTTPARVGLSRCLCIALESRDEEMETSRCKGK